MAKHNIDNPDYLKDFIKDGDNQEDLINNLEESIEDYENTSRADYEATPLDKDNEDKSLTDAENEELNPDSESNPDNEFDSEDDYDNYYTDY